MGNTSIAFAGHIIAKLLVVYLIVRPHISDEGRFKMYTNVFQPVISLSSLVYLNNEISKFIDGRISLQSKEQGLDALQKRFGTPLRHLSRRSAAALVSCCSCLCANDSETHEPCCRARYGCFSSVSEVPDDPTGLAEFPDGIKAICAPSILVQLGGLVLYIIYPPGWSANCRGTANVWDGKFCWDWWLWFPVGLNVLSFVSTSAMNWLALTRLWSRNHRPMRDNHADSVYDGSTGSCSFPQWE